MAKYQLLVNEKSDDEVVHQDAAPPGKLSAFMRRIRSILPVFMRTNHVDKETQPLLDEMSINLDSEHEEPDEQPSTANTGIVETPNSSEVLAFSNPLLLDPKTLTFIRAIDYQKYQISNCDFHRRVTLKIKASWENKHLYKSLVPLETMKFSIIAPVYDFKMHKKQQNGSLLIKWTFLEARLESKKEHKRFWEGIEKRPDFREKQGSITVDCVIFQHPKDCPPEVLKLEKQRRKNEERLSVKLADKANVAFSSTVCRSLPAGQDPYKEPDKKPSTVADDFAENKPSTSKGVATNNSRNEKMLSTHRHQSSNRHNLLQNTTDGPAFYVRSNISNRYLLVKWNIWEQQHVYKCLEPMETYKFYVHLSKKSSLHKMKWFQENGNVSIKWAFSNIKVSIKKKQMKYWRQIDKPENFNKLYGYIAFPFICYKASICYSQKIFKLEKLRSKNAEEVVRVELAVQDLFSGRVLRCSASG